MSRSVGGFVRRVAPLVACAVVVAGWTGAAAAQTAKIAVIDVQRLVTDSVSGKDALAKLKKLQDDKIAEGKAKQDDIEGLRKKVNDARLSLSDDKVAEMEKQLDDKVTGFRRFQEDAEKEFNKSKDQMFAEIERKVFPVIEQIGKEGGYTLIFNKYQSGLVYADDGIDITDQIIKRFDAASAPAQPNKGQ